MQQSKLPPGQWFSYLGNGFFTWGMISYLGNVVRRWESTCKQVAKVLLGASKSKVKRRCRSSVLLRPERFVLKHLLCRNISSGKGFYQIFTIQRGSILPGTKPLAPRPTSTESYLPWQRQVQCCQKTRTGNEHLVPGFLLPSPASYNMQIQKG